MLSVHAPVKPPTPGSQPVESRPTVLITEQAVKLLTAAAIATPAPAKAGLLSRWFAASRAVHENRPSRWRYAPQHYAFLEYAAMARAMERL